MLHSPLFFLFFFPVALLLERVRGADARSWILVVASGAFLAALSPSAFLAILTISSLAWLCSKAVSRIKSAPLRTVLFGVSSSLLSALILFKAASLFTVFGPIAGVSFSFFCLPLIAFLTDIWRGQPMPQASFVQFLAFSSYFPSVLAGPIQRFQGFVPQLAGSWARGRERLPEAAGLLLRGLFKKLVLADRLGELDTTLVLAASPNTPLLFLPHFYLFMIRTYFDFSGYTDIARGISLCFGIDLPLNFDRPFSAVNPIDFWRRWHMSLSQWMRDYVYYPLFFLTKNLYLCFFLTFLCNGVWHAIEWNFLFLGVFWGTSVTFYLLLKPRWDALPKAVQVFLMWQIFAASFVFFEPDGLNRAMKILSGPWAVSPLGGFLKDNSVPVAWYVFSLVAYGALKWLLPKAGTRAMLLLAFVTSLFLYALSPIEGPGYIYAQF